MAVRLIPYSVYDVPAMEHWLEEMSRKGLHLDLLYGHYATFRRGEPRECRYRLEPWGRDTPRLDDEMLALYETAGWEYVQRILGEEFHVWRSVRPDARELHDDPIVQSYGFAWAERRIRRVCLICAAAFLAVLAIVAGTFWYDSTRLWPYPWPRELRDWSYLIRSFPGLLLCFTSVSGILMDFLAVRRVKKCLQEGIPMERRRGGFPYRKTLFWGLLLGCAGYVLLSYYVVIYKLT